jgi:hypothetical protein
MGLKEWFVNGFKQLPLEAGKAAYNAKRNEQVANGVIHRCSACGLEFAGHRTECKRCTQGTAPDAPRVTFLVRNYTGHKPDKEFIQEAQALAQHGWHVTSQSQGGHRTFQTINMGRIHAASMTVTYERS